MVKMQHEIADSNLRGAGFFQPNPPPELKWEAKERQPWQQINILMSHNESNETFTPLKTNMTMETPPFEDVFPIENGDFPMSS